LLARQLRLRLVAEEGTDIPKNLHNIVVSIHAIATFQALHDYLRPRVSGVLSGATRLSSMLAALAAGVPGSSARDPIVEPSQPAPSSTSPAAEASTSAAGSSSSQAPTRRRSQRLREKKSGNVAAAASASGSAAPPDAPPPEATPSSMSAAPVSEAAPSDTLVDDERGDAFEAEFTDDEYDAEVRPECAAFDTPLTKQSGGRRGWGP
jgi:E3 ubiquitin-protein ligase TRIP12